MEVHPSPYQTSAAESSDRTVRPALAEGSQTDYTEAMTTALKSVFSRLSRLPEREQERYAQQIQRELDASERWDELFEQTDDATWQAMVDEAVEDAEDNGTLSLEELKRSL